MLEAEHMAMLQLACCNDISQVILMNIKPMLGIVLIASYLAALVSPMHAQTAGEVLKAYETLTKLQRKTRLIEGAKKEGRLVFYGTLGVDASRPMLEKFRQSYPYISIDHYRSGSVGIYNRVVNEARAGKHEVDIIELSAGPVSDLIRGGFVDPYRSTETDAVRQEFIDPRHFWNAYHYLVVGLAYNKTLVRVSEVPKAYEDLLLPRWQGRKMSLDRDAGDVFGGLLDSWGEKQGLEYFRRLAKQDVLIRSGYTLQAQLLAAGEVEVVPWSHAQRPLLMADSGAPLGVTFLEPVQSKAQVLLLARRSPHPHAAALFIDWALSEEGQTFVGIDIVRSPVRIGQKQKYMELGRPKTKVITPEFLGQNYERYTQLYHEIFAVK
jgi:ABC-type Fe3+ transport system substrate-binding protein